MKILVTGASGYIGSYLCRWLANRGSDFGTVSRSQPDYLNSVISDIPFYLTDLDLLQSLRVSEKYDVLIHLASANDIDSSDARRALLTTGFGARQAVDFCKTNKIHQLIYFSTFQVYGTNQGEVDESTPTRCLNDYALTHLVGEEYIRLAQTRGDVEGIIFRPTNIYGAPLSADVDRWSLVPGCFCKQAIETGAITLNSSGKQVRDFISLEDIANLTYLFSEQFNLWKNQTINLASGQVHSIFNTASLTARVFSDLTGKDCPVNILSNQPEENGFLTVNTENISGLPYHCKDTMEAEIRKTFNLLGIKHGPN